MLQDYNNIQVMIKSYEKQPRQQILNSPQIISNKKREKKNTDFPQISSYYEQQQNKQNTYKSYQQQNISMNLYGMQNQYSNWVYPEIYKTWYESQPIYVQNNSEIPISYEQRYWQYQNYFRYLQNQQYYQQNQSFLLNANQIGKKKKLSKNQKRRQRKKQLMKEFQQQQRLLGKLVKIERKDLIQDLEEIKLKQQKDKAKKRQKLSYLIQIHKEVYKFKLKKKNIQASTAKIKTKKTKKRLSHIKKMKNLYLNQNSMPKSEIVKNQYKKDSKQHQKIEQNDQGYVTDSQDEQKQKNIKSADKKEIQEIEYKFLGKLSGKIYNKIVLRQWVDNVQTQELEDKALRIINRLAYKQAIKKINQPEKAKKIIVGGIHEVKRTLVTILQKKQSKCLIVAINIERNNLQRGTDDQIQQLILLAHQKKIPVIHTSIRSRLGRAFIGKFGPRVTIVSIINYEGYADMMEQLLEEWRRAKQAYNEL